MKKIFTLMAAAVMALAANAKDFTDNLVVTLAGSSTNTPDTKLIVDEVENSDGLYNLTLKDFKFGPLTIGDINIENVKGNDDTEGYTYFEEAKTTIKVPIIGSADVTLKENGYMKGDKLYLEMSISALNMDISAIYGIAIYDDNLSVSMNGNPLTEGKQSIYVTDQKDGKYTISLKNFSFTMGFADMNVGTIEINDVEMTDVDGIKNFTFNSPVTIKEGDDADIKWVMAGETVPVEMTGKMTSDQLYTVISINLGSMQISVTFGEDITSGISNVTTTTGDGVEAIYDLSGKKLNELQKGVNIVRKADGTTVKVLKK